jgi:hypothetical protein
MRIIACLVAVLWTAPPAHAQSPIEWSAERRLTKEDFRGRVPMQSGNASLSWLHIETSWECVVGDLVASARALFDPSQSWWRTTYGNVWGSAGDRTTATQAQSQARRNVMQMDRQLLDHEQLHFDLTELAARKIRNRFAEFKDACLEPGGTEPIQAMVFEVDRELQDQQREYDRETGHGVNVRAQDQWAQRVKALLK